ncbi:hypothetical protein NDU88_004811 [Pleurodeles waltl]|uniref:Uncharacterized protein n=1 Tax=Pleurodeles waltl TaxID=8319 RepID=A0AAV7WWW9_PLEWA|nr:hypothetical protein NDU88_004811 [Pleurodeles waltl]
MGQIPSLCLKAPVYAAAVQSASRVRGTYQKPKISVSRPINQHEGRTARRITRANGDFAPFVAFVTAGLLAFRIEIRPFFRPRALKHTCQARATGTLDNVINIDMAHV